MDGVKHSPTDNKVVTKEAVVAKLITVEQDKTLADTEGNVMPSAGGGAHHEAQREGPHGLHGATGAAHGCLA